MDEWRLFLTYGGCFEFNVLAYINTTEHKWDCCIGLSYGNIHGQVGERSEQNSRFTMPSIKAKEELISKKNSVGQDCTIHN